MEDNKNVFSKMSSAGKTVMIVSGIFAVLVIGVSVGAGMSRDRMMNNFSEDRFDRFDRGFNRQTNDVRRGGCDGGCEMQQKAGGCAKMQNVSPTAGCNFERQIIQNEVPATIYIDEIATSSETIK